MCTKQDCNNEKKKKFINNSIHSHAPHLWMWAR